MLLEKTANGYKNMVVSDYPEMTQFLTSITMPEDDHGGKGSIIVEFVSSGSTKSNTLKIPLRPNTEKLEAFEVNMHDSPTKAYKMPAEYNTWFSQCFGYEVLLAYLGDGLREVLFEDLKPVKHKSWLMNILKSLSFLGHSLFKGYQITFADCSPYLIVSKTSLADVSSRLPDGEEMDVTKFRPNIVIRGAAKAWEEDYWGQLDINGAEIVPAHNCVRCKSINIDYSTGKPATGASGEVLKKLQKDRRVDMGAKWSPVFGRYSFWNPKYGSRMFKVGDEVVVRKLNKERTTWSGSTPKQFIASLTNKCLAWKGIS